MNDIARELNERVDNARKPLHIIDVLREADDLVYAGKMTNGEWNSIRANAYQKARFEGWLQPTEEGAE